MKNESAMIDFYKNTIPIDCDNSIEEVYKN
jgi:hypothetical protein